MANEVLRTHRAMSMFALSLEDLRKEYEALAGMGETFTPLLICEGPGKKSPILKLDPTDWKTAIEHGSKRPHYQNGIANVRLSVDEIIRGFEKLRAGLIPTSPSGQQWVGIGRYPGPHGGIYDFDLSKAEKAAGVTPGECDAWRRYHEGDPDALFPDVFPLPDNSVDSITGTQNGFHVRQAWIHHGTQISKSSPAELGLNIDFRSGEAGYGASGPGSWVFGFEIVVIRATRTTILGQADEHQQAAWKQMHERAKKAKDKKPLLKSAFPPTYIKSAWASNPYALWDDDKIERFFGSRHTRIWTWTKLMAMHLNAVDDDVAKYAEYLGTRFMGYKFHEIEILREHIAEGIEAAKVERPGLSRHRRLVTTDPTERKRMHEQLLAGADIDTFLCTRSERTFGFGLIAATMAETLNGWFPINFKAHIAWIKTRIAEGCVAAPVPKEVGPKDDRRIILDIDGALDTDVLGKQGKSFAEEAIRDVAERNKTDSFIKLFLEHKKVVGAPAVKRAAAQWNDGNKPFRTILTLYGVEAEEEIAFGAEGFFRLFLATAGRAYRPGLPYQLIPMLVAPPEHGKTMLVEAFFGRYSYMLLNRAFPQPGEDRKGKSAVSIIEKTLSQRITCMALFDEWALESIEKENKFNQELVATADIGRGLWETNLDAKLRRSTWIATRNQAKMRTISEGIARRVMAIYLTPTDGKRRDFEREIEKDRSGS